MLAFAGLWERWLGPDGSEIDSCTILTTDANAVTAPLHDRMPVMLAHEDFDQWLGTGQDATVQELEQLRHLLRPCPAEMMVATPVSRFVNNPRNEGEACIVPPGEGDL